MESVGEGDMEMEMERVREIERERERAFFKCRRRPFIWLTPIHVTL